MADFKKLEKVKWGPILTNTLTSFLYPQVIFLFLVSIFIAIAIVFLGFTYFKELLNYSKAMFFETQWPNLILSYPFLNYFTEFLKSISEWVVIIAILALSIPLVIVLNLIVLSILSSTYLVKLIARRDFKNLEIKGRARFVNGLLNTLSASLIYLFLWLMTLPLWLIPLGAFVLPLVLTAWLNQRVCSFDALTEFASDEEMKTLKIETQSQGYILGLMMAALNYIPFALFFTPVLSMVAYTHLNLAVLQKSRTSSKN
jgi:hypothetical protein